MSWARMVVVAVRDPATGHPAARLARRLLLAAGFTFAAWLAGLVLGTFTASAQEAEPSSTHDGQALSEPRLMAALAGTLGELNGLTHLTALTGTVEHVAARVTQTALAVAPEPDGGTSPPAAERSDPRPPDPSASEPPGIPPFSPRMTPAPPSAPATAAVTPQRRAPVARTHPIVQAGARPSPAPREAAPAAASQQATGHPPVPPPGGNDDHTVGVGVPHDAGGGKQPFVVPGTRPGAADRRPAGQVTGGKGLAPARKAALPTTSPD